jgi:peptidoglycan hydrolase-like protein with peptidoglycan-binding domain
VVRRVHDADASDIEGYCRPEYHKVVPVQPSPSGGRTELIVRALPRLERNDKGADVKRLQGLLVANGHTLPDSTKSDGTFDGQFGDETEREVRKLTGSNVVDGAQWKKLLGV